MTSSWQKLTQILSFEYREKLADALLEALNSSQWQRIDIEIRDHRMHAIDLTKRIHPPKIKNKADLTSQS
jgi:hypothetical protein